MVEYIEKQKTIKLLDMCMAAAEKRWKEATNPLAKIEFKADKDTIETMIEVVVSVESADVQPVVHAYWIELPKALNPNENPCKCSNCGHILSFMNGYPKSKYCDECGAKMDVIYEDDEIRAIKITG